MMSISSAVLRLIGAVVVTGGGLHLAVANLPAAAAAPCPDVEVVFARGTTEPPGVGTIGQVFVDAVRSQLGGRSVGVYPVNYPATRDFSSSAPVGRDDASSHIQSTAANCPNTKMVLGGYSQGAAVVDLATSAMPAQVADHVAAAAIFGGPRSSFADSLSPGPMSGIGPMYAAKTIDLCVPNDPVCFEGGWDWGAHGAYIQSGMVDRAAAFAASRLQGGRAAP